MTVIIKKPVVDKIAILLPKKLHRKKHHDHMRTLNRALRARRILEDTHFHSTYSQHYFLPLRSGERALVESIPKYSANARGDVRITLNPAKGAYDDLPALFEYIEAAYSIDPAVVMARALIAEMHIAVDVAGVRIEDMLLRDTKKDSSSIVLRGFGLKGRAKTVYLGSNLSDDQLRIYDKELELLEQAKNVRSTKEKAPSIDLMTRSPLVRIESRSKDIFFPVSRIDSLPTVEYDSGFKNLEIYSHRLVLCNLEDTEQIFFLDACRFRGVPAALRLIKDRNVRRRHAQMLRAGRFNWWNSERIDKLLPDALWQTGLFPQERIRQDNNFEWN